MPNLTNEENWASRERLRCIERAMWWRGWVGRSDLTELFGISAAQASGDLQRYQQLNPGALSYHTSRKRYEAVAGSGWVIAEPSFGEAVSVYLGDGARVQPIGVGQSARIAGVALPMRRGRPEVERAVVMAALQGRSVRVRYFSVGSGKVGWRTLVPHSFGHDGYRWHARAWCMQAEGYRDFVLGRMENVEWPGAVAEALPADEDWQTIDVVCVRPHRALTESARRAIELDYGIAAGETLVCEVRRAMKEYLLAHLRVEGLALPRHFELAE